MSRKQPTIAQTLQTKYNLELRSAEPDGRRIYCDLISEYRTIAFRCAVVDAEGKARSVYLLDNGTVLRDLIVWAGDFRSTFEKVDRKIANKKAGD